MRLWLSLRATMKIIKADVRECERVNKQITLISNRSPSCSLDLLSSRVCIKHYLGQGGDFAAMMGGHNLRWSSVQPVAESLLKQCSQHWHEREKVSCDSTRFQAPSVPEGLPSPAATRSHFVKLMPQLQVTGSSMWAAAQVSRWRAHETTLLNFEVGVGGASRHKRVVSFGQAMPGDTVYIEGEKVRSTGHMLKCKVESCGQKVSIVFPFQIMSLLDIFHGFYESVQDGSEVDVFQFRCTWQQALHGGLKLAGDCNESTWVMQLRPLKALTPTLSKSKVPFSNLGGVASSIPPQAASSSSSDTPGAASSSINMDVEEIKEIVKLATADGINGDEMIKILDDELGHDGSDEEDSQRTKRDMEAEIGEKMSSLHEQQVLKGKNIKSSFVEPLAKEMMISSGLLPEEAALDAALSSSQAMGNIDIKDVMQQNAGKSKMAVMAYEEWNRQFLDGVDILKERLQALREVPLQHGELSLIRLRESGTVVYVNWESPWKKTGRIAQLDNESRVKYTVRVGRNRLASDFSNAEILHPAIGVEMIRRRGPKGCLRPQVPTSVVKLQRMFNAGSSRVALGPCALCGDMDDRSDSNSLRLCLLCEQCWHGSCSWQFVYDLSERFLNPEALPTYDKAMLPTTGTEELSAFRPAVCVKPE